MSTFSLKVHDLFGFPKSTQSKPRLQVVPPNTSPAEEIALSLAEFAVHAQMQGLGLDRKSAIASLQKALHSILSSPQS